MENVKLTHRQKLALAAAKDLEGWFFVDEIRHQARVLNQLVDRGLLETRTFFKEMEYRAL